MKSLFLLVTAVNLITFAVRANPAPERMDRSSVSIEHGALSSGEDKNESCPVENDSDVAAGNKLLQEGRPVEGRAQLESALAALQRAGAPGKSQACLMNVIGVVERQQRRSDVAIEWFQRALLVKPLPDALVARLTSNLAGACFDLNQMDRAEALSRRAIELYERAFGSDHPETIFPQATLASVHAAREEYTRAEPVFRRILYVAERNWSPSSYDVAVAAGNLALVYMAQARYSLARELFEKSIAGLENNPARANGEVPIAQAGLAVSCAAGGRHRDARMWLEGALAQAERELSPTDDLWPVILERLAMARFFLKDYESGRQMFDRAIALLDVRYGPGSPQVQGAFDRYLTVLRRVNDKRGTRMLESRRKAFAH